MARVTEQDRTYAAPATEPSPLEWKADSALCVGPQRMLDAIRNDISLMLWPERVLLYATVYGLRPERILEVGSFRGGSALIMTAALDDIGGEGRIVCIDPEPKVSPETWARIGHRAAMIAEQSPWAQAKAPDLAGGRFDFALIDGNHSYDCVLLDTEASLAVLTDQAYLLFHDAHYFEVVDGINHLLHKYPNELTDLGMISTLPAVDPVDPNVRWGGFRLARFNRAR
jgi:hypothetical protein